MRADLVRALSELKNLRVLKVGYSNIDTDSLKTLNALKSGTIGFGGMRLG